jgi:integrase/recombinase XerC
MVELLYGSGLRVAELVGWMCSDSSACRHAAGLTWPRVGPCAGQGQQAPHCACGRATAMRRAATLDGRAGWPRPHVARNPTTPGRGCHCLWAVNGTRLTPTRSGTTPQAPQPALAGLATPVHPHMLRHSFASHVLQSSGDLRAVQELLGHANISTTQVYTRLDFQHLAKAYDAAHPRAKRK